MTEEHKTPICTNCSYEFIYANNYCPVCGQKNHELRIPLKYLIKELLETTLHFDSKTIRTLKSLIIKPGFLSLEFNLGRRANYVPPVRLYVLISFIFFFLINLLGGGHKNDFKHSRNHQIKSGLSISYKGIYSHELSGFSIRQTDSLIVARNIKQTNLNKYLIHQMHRIANSSSTEFSHSLMKNISYMMFFLMPVFGFWIYLFNKKRLQYYIEGLTVSIHFHSFVFVVFTFLVLLSSIFSRELFLLVGLLIVPFYMFFMFRRVLQQSWFITFSKTIAIGVLYLISLMTLLVVTVVISILLV